MRMRRGVSTRVSEKRLMKPKRRSHKRKRMPVAKRPVVIAGRRTSISLEDNFWQALKTIASFEKIQLSDLVLKINQGKHNANLSSAIGLFILDYYRRLG
jgi:predicted DNA-binding ribbon-helix-helix protein